ncbi:MAG: phage tail protein [Chloroflexota bacterium]
MPTRETDPLLSYQFALEVDGLTGYFTEVSGITSEHEVVEHKVVTPEGKEVLQMIPGRIQWSEITLKRGVTNNMELWKWRELVVQGDTVGARKPATITMFDRNYTAVAKWNIVNAWPSKISGPDLQSDSNDYGVEELTLIHEGLTRDGAQMSPVG